MATHITVSSGTPPPSERDAARFTSLILPPVRNRSWWDGPGDGFTTYIGDILDAPPRRSCAYRFMWRNRREQWSGIVRQQFCGRLECSRCVAAYLTRRVGGAWSYWAGSASVLILDDAESATVQKRLRREAGVKLQGDDATIAAVSLGIVGGRIIFYPGDDLRGDELNEEYVAAIRAVEVQGTARSGANNSARAGLSLDLTVAQQREAARRAGVTVKYASPTKVFAENVTDEQHEAWLAELRALSGKQQLGHPGLQVPGGKQLVGHP